MTPGDLNIPIYRGAKWDFVFRFRVTGTETPVDLTGLGPFVCQIKALNADRVLATGTITSDYDDTGLVRVTFTAAQTHALPVGKVRMGLRDALNNPYAEGTPEVKWFTPNSA